MRHSLSAGAPRGNAFCEVGSTGAVSDCRPQLGWSPQQYPAGGRHSPISPSQASVLGCQRQSCGAEGIRLPAVHPAAPARIPNRPLANAVCQPPCRATSRSLDQGSGLPHSHGRGVSRWALCRGALPHGMPQDIEPECCPLFSHAIRFARRRGTWECGVRRCML